MSDAAMIVAGAIACLGLAGAGSAFGTGFAAAAAVGAWKKCYAANKQAPFLLLSFVGAPITQTLYGMILMFIMLGKISNGAAAPGAGVPVLVAGIFAGLAIGLSALFQGRAGAAACDAQAETNQGFTN
ncbi:MAG: V-type ATP synthase subunit K, partial [Kiritimatiellae bacterium]|nr:V-type ATP synthase subunit K [Kiritimatiellia bacterium]